MIRLFTPLLIVFWSFSLKGQDTVLVGTLETEGRVVNIDTDGDRLLIRYKDKAIILPEGKELALTQTSPMRFSWFSKNSTIDQLELFHTEFLPPDKVIEKENLRSILPGFPTNHITVARVANAFYICYRGVVLHYRIDPFIKIVHKGRSIRNVFCNDTIRIISGYNGIFMDRLLNFDGYSEMPMKGTYYSNGETAAFGGNIYLCQDGLYRPESDSAWRCVSTEVNNAAFRKILDWNGESLALFTNRLSFFNLDTFREGKVLLSGKEFTDIELAGDTLLCADTSGALYRLTKDGWCDTLHVTGCIYDIGKLSSNPLLACESGIYRYHQNGRISKLAGGITAIQTAVYRRFIFFTNYEGFYLMMNDTVFTIVENVEFNKKALNIHNNTLYAGSIDGLYTIQLNSFESNMLPGLKPIIIKVDQAGTRIWMWVIGILLVLLIVAIWILIARKRSPELVIQPVQAPAITPDALRELIRTHPELITIQALADKLNTSVVQLNRKLKKFNDTPLNLMQDVKRDIAREMHAGGHSMDEIARRTGYSKRYIRENFLNT